MYHHHLSPYNNTTYWKPLCPLPLSILHAELFRLPLLHLPRPPMLQAFYTSISSAICGMLIRRHTCQPHLLFLLPLSVWYKVTTKQNDMATTNGSRIPMS